MKAWERFWFTPAPPEPLALARIVLYGMLFAVYAYDDLAFVPQLAQLRWRPISFFAVLFPDGPPPQWLTSALQVIWRGALVAAMTGWRTRTAAIIAAPIGLYLIGLPYNVSRLSHESAAAVLALCVLAFARSGDALSVDARGQSPAKSPGPDAAYRWPMRLVQVIISLVFFSAGLAKLRHAGLEWITSDNLQLLIAGRERPLGSWLVEQPFLCRALAAATMIVELGHPLALFSKRAAWIFVPAGIGMLCGSWLFLGVPFWPLLVLHVFWLPPQIAATASRKGI